MKLAVVGTGYVGLVTGTCLAEVGNTVTCVDVDESKIRRLQDGIIPIYEPGLEDLVKSNYTAKRLQFTTNLVDAVHGHEILMIAVGTPPNEDGSADLKHVLNVARVIGETMTSPKLIITKSTVPVGTGDKIKTTIHEALKKRGAHVSFSIASNPEFLKEGAAVNDFMRPDRIVVGCEDDFAKKRIEQLYSPFILNRHPVIFMDIRSAELTKYAANAMLATKISFMNEIAQVAEKVGADVTAVRNGIGSDARIGYHFTYPGIGYGGSCFPKDVKALRQTARENGLNVELLNAVENVNKSQRERFIKKIENHYAGAKSKTSTLAGRKFAVWGLSFKPETDDIREAPSLDIIGHLLRSGAHVAAFDPIAGENAREYFEKHEGSKLEICTDQYTPLEQADALLLLTEWKPFRSPDFERMKSLLKQPVIFDGRNQYDLAQMRELGFRYFCVGRPPV